MSKCKVPPDNDFLNWFESLTVAEQNKVLRIAERLEWESFIEVAATNLVANSPFHIASPLDSPFILN